jgi:hypothetical protein
MQSFLRALNIVCSPVLTLFFASRLGRFSIFGEHAADTLGGVLAGLVVLGVEILLSQGPKHNAWLRRWLDPRAVFEGAWIQDVFEADGDNAFGIFRLDYVPESDAFAVSGAAYSRDGSRWAKWDSTHLFIDRVGLHATYEWRGELFGGRTATPADKSGVVELELRRPPEWALPLVGEGRVLHLGEGTRLKFHLRRITNEWLHELGLRMTVRQLQVNGHDEEQQLVAALLERRAKPAVVHALA